MFFFFLFPPIPQILITLAIFQSFTAAKFFTLFWTEAWHLYFFLA